MGELADLLYKMEDLEMKLADLKLEERFRQLDQSLQKKMDHIKFELMAELMVIEQSIPGEPRRVSVTEESTQTEQMHVVASLEGSETEEFQSGAESVQDDDEEKEKSWIQCREDSENATAACSWDERLALSMFDGTLEFYCSGEYVGSYIKLKGFKVTYMWCSSEYIVVQLHEGGVGCFSWNSCPAEFLYWLWLKEPNNWECADEVTRSGVDYTKFYCMTREHIVSLNQDWVGSWSIPEKKSCFRATIPGAHSLASTLDLILVYKKTLGEVDVFTLEGTKAYCLRIRRGIDNRFPTIITNTNFSVLMFDSKCSCYAWRSTKNRSNKLIVIKSSIAALHPQKPWLLCCEGTDLILKNISKDTVLWRRKENFAPFKVHSLNSDHALVIFPQLDAQIHKWSSGEIMSYLPFRVDVLTSSPLYIVTNQEMYYKQ